MAKIARCEQCGNEERLGLFGSAPAGWFEVTEHKPGSEADGKHELCSAACVGKWGGELAAARAEAAGQVEAERARVAQLVRH